MPALKIRCKGSGLVDLDAVRDFQGGLKTLSPKRYEKFKTRLAKRGFIAPLYLWEHGDELYSLDGHQRVATLKKMRTEGWDIPKLPYAQIEAKSWAEAKEMLLDLVAQYGEISGAGLHAYIEGAKIKPDLVDEIPIPGIDAEEFMVEFYDAKPEEPYGDTRSPFERAEGEVEKGKVEFIKTCPNCGEKFS